MRDINLGLHGSAGPQKPKETGKVRDSKCSLFFVNYCSIGPSFFGL